MEEDANTTCEKRFCIWNVRIRFTITIFSTCIHCEGKATSVYALKKASTSKVFLTCYIEVLGYIYIFTMSGAILLFVAEGKLMLRRVVRVGNMQY